MPSPTNVPDPSPKETARWSIEGTIRKVAVDVYDSATVEVPIWPGARTTKTTVEPLAGIRAAIFVRDVARNRIHEYVKEARGAGRTWAEIAAVFDLDAEVTNHPGAAVFEYAAIGEPLPRPERRYPFDPRNVHWRCASCGLLITDSGPYNGNPVDDESGHAETCERHAAEIAAWRARWDAEEEDEAPTEDLRHWEDADEDRARQAGALGGNEPSTEDDPERGVTP